MHSMESRRDARLKLSSVVSLISSRKVVRPKQKKMDFQPSSSTGKRKRDDMTIEQKLEILNELKKDSTAVALAARFGVPCTMINDLKKKQRKSSTSLHKCNRPMADQKNRKTMKKATNEALDEAVYLGFVQKRCEGIPLSGPILCEKAIQFNEKLGGDGNFKASSGWLHKFKSRHGIREGEKMSAVTAETVAAFKKKRDWLKLLLLHFFSLSLNILSKS